MNKEILDVRIKAWLCALALLVLGIGVGFCIIISPKIIGAIVGIILFIVGIFLFLYVIALALNEVMK